MLHALNRNRSDNNFRYSTHTILTTALQEWPMSILPLKPWVNYTRKAILWVGFGSPVAGLIYESLSPQPASLTWSLIGIIFMSTIFLPVALLAAVVLPSYKLRILGVPVALVLLFWWKASGAAGYKGFNIPLGMMQWIATFTAVTLLLPQTTSLVRFVEGMFRRES